MSEPLTVSPSNPYVGPRSFQTGEKMYGRDKEAQDLLDLLIAERILILHSPSGAGKSSLVQAGLIPQMITEGFYIFPTVRLNLDVPPGCQSACNRYAFSAMMSLEEALDQDHKHPIDQLAGWTLMEYMSHREAPEDEPAFKLLILDQFEEILTVDPTDQAGKVAFFEQLGEVLRDRKFWALVAIREDFMGALDPYVRPIPTRLNNRFRLDLLSAQAALQAIQKPAQAAGVTFQQEAVEKMVNDLRQVRIQQADGSTKVQSGPYVEPVQLQVVCYNLWQHLPPETKEITLQQIKDVGDVDESLATYYAEKVCTAAEALKLPERQVRDWFEHRLITKQGIRGLVQMGTQESEGLDNRAIRMLENDHLVRAENRLGSTWFELAHDRLIDPIRKNNAAWMQQNLNLLQRQAILWAQQGRPDSLLLMDKDLEDARQWAGANAAALTDDEKAFLTDCQQAEERRSSQREQERLEQERREQTLKLEAAEKLAGAEKRRAEEQAKAAKSLRRRAVYLAFALAAALCLTVIAFAFWQRSIADSRMAKAQAETAVFARGLALAAQGTSDANAISAIEAQKTSDYNAQLANREKLNADAQRGTAEVASTQAIQEKNKAVAESNLRATAQSQISRSRADALASVTYSLDSQPDLRKLLSIEAYRMLDTPQTRLALLSALQYKQALLFDPYGVGLPAEIIPISYMTIQIDGKYLAWGNDNGDLILYDVNQQQELWPRKRIHSGAISAIGLCSANGQEVLVTGGVDNQVRALNVATGAVKWANRAPNEVNSISITNDCSRVAVAAGGAVDIYAATDGSKLVDTLKLDNSVTSVAFSPNGAKLALGMDNGKIEIYTTTKGFTTLGYQASRVNNFAWLPDNRSLASTGQDQMITIWNTDLIKMQTQFKKNAFGKSDSVAISPDGKLLAASERLGQIEVWDLESGNNFKKTLHSGDVGDIEFANDQGKLLLASSGADNRIVLTEIRIQQPLSSSITNPGPVPYAFAIGPDGSPSSAGPTENGIGTITMATDAVAKADLSRIAISPDGSKMAIGGKDGSIAVLNGVDSGKPEPLTSIQAAPSAILGLAFSPDGNTLASTDCVGESTTKGQLTCSQADIQFWDVATGKPSRDPLSYPGIRVTSLAYSEDGKTLACGSYGSLINWDLGSGKATLLNTIPANLGSISANSSGWIDSLAFSPDRKTLAVGTDVSTIGLVDLVSGKSYSPLFTSDKTRSPVLSLAYDPKGDYLYSGFSDGTILRWDASPELWIDKACQFAKQNISMSDWNRYLPGDPYHQTCPDYPAGS